MGDIGKMRVRPMVLTIAGSDSSGGAGIQADVNSISANGGHAATVVTAVTAQGGRGVEEAEVLPARLVRAQIDAVFDGANVAAVKTGMLGSAEIVHVAAEGIRARGPRPYVCDPVITSSSGFPLLRLDSIGTLVRELFPLASLITPNVDEARALSGIEIRTEKDAEAAGARLLEMGARAVLVKGGHLAASPATDLLVTPEGSRRFQGTWVSSRHTHGTGCIYSAAIATHLARGLSLAAAIGMAKEFVTEAILWGFPLGDHDGVPDPFFFLRTASEGARWIERLQETPVVPGPGRIPGVLQVITDETIQSRFAHEDLARLAAAGGAQVVQFREKRPRSTAELVDTARRMALALAGTGARLVVNDRVDVAVAARVSAVHLGSADLDPAIARRLLGPGALIGRTANSVAEARDAAVADVDYLGVGPVFGTRTKASPAPALGLDGLREIVRSVTKPVVAIGSLTPEDVSEVMETGVQGIAVAAAVVCDADPAEAARRFRERIDAWVGRVPA